MNAARGSRLPFLAAAIAVAIGLIPSMVGLNFQPSPTFFNQIAAVFLSGLFVIAASGQRIGRPPWALLAVLGLLAMAIYASQTFGTLPYSMGLQALGYVIAATLMVLSGASARGEQVFAGRAAGSSRNLLTPFFVGFVAAGMLSGVVACIQVFAPGLADGLWISEALAPGRAIGNLRQANHLASLLLWAIIAVVALHELGCLGRHHPGNIAAALMAFLVLALVLTASRSAIVGVLLLAAWGAWDKFRGRQLTRAGQRLLFTAPVYYAVWWTSVTAWARTSQHLFSGDARIAGAGTGDISSSRFGIWANALDLIRAQPWTGVGFGNFNLAWTLTPFPDRPKALFDNAHNLPLHLFAELGIPLGGLVVVLLLVALWQAWMGGRADIGARAASMFVVVIGFHSLLEYPLWHAYFLLPAAWTWGYALGAPKTPSDGALAVTERATRSVAGRSVPPWALIGGVTVAAVSCVAVWDYLRVARMFDPAFAGVSMSRRVAESRSSVFFGHIGDYAAAIRETEQPDGLRAFESAAHYVLDPRLMAAWARALAREGQLDEARFLAARIREFGEDRAPEFFAPCSGPGDGSAARFMCERTSKALDWRDFVRR